MNLLRTLLIAAVAAIATTQAAVINHDAVVPFGQPNPTTISQKAAVKFKPQLHITNGCHPYPAVNANGDTSGGLQESGNPSGGCRGSGHGSQIYARATWYNGVWAIMYSWYFPKDSPMTNLGHRHDWENVVVWLDNPANANPKVLAVSASGHGEYSRYKNPGASNFRGTSALLDYYAVVVVNHRLRITTQAGESQPLIMWDQLTPAARTALQNTDFRSANVPFKDGNFLSNLGKAWYK